jgi:hypothetical protein
MGLFSAIMDKLRHHAPAPGQQAQQSAVQPQSQPAAAPQQAQQAPAQSAPQAGSAQAIQNVDVDAVLSQLAEKKGGGGNWRTSIVDTLKLLDLDSSLEARKELAGELDVHAGAHGSAEQNVALQKALMKKLAENGGKVPASLRD